MGVKPNHPPLSLLQHFILPYFRCMDCKVLGDVFKITVKTQIPQLWKREYERTIALIHVPVLPLVSFPKWKWYNCSLIAYYCSSTMEDNQSEFRPVRKYRDFFQFLQPNSRGRPFPFSSRCTINNRCYVLFVTVRDSSAALRRKKRLPDYRLRPMKKETIWNTFLISEWRIDEW